MQSQDVAGTSLGSESSYIEHYGGWGPDCPQFDPQIKHFAHEVAHEAAHEAPAAPRNGKNEEAWDIGMDSRTPSFDWGPETSMRVRVDRPRRSERRPKMHKSTTQALFTYVLRPVKNKFSVELFVHIALAISTLLYVNFLSGATSTSA